MFCSVPVVGSTLQKISKEIAKNAIVGGLEYIYLQIFPDCYFFTYSKPCHSCKCGAMQKVREGITAININCAIWCNELNRLSIDLCPPELY